MNTTTRGNRLHVYDATLDLVRALRPLLPRIKRISPTLETQLRRALESCALNLAEGRAHIGRTQSHSWRIAQGSAHEVHSALEIAEALGGLEHASLADIYALLDRIHAMLYRMTH